MTSNQIAYWNLQEQKRSNLEKEKETNRSNLAKEQETFRSNLVKEGETRRSNLVNEDLNRAAQSLKFMSDMTATGERAISNAIKNAASIFG